VNDELKSKIVKDHTLMNYDDDVYKSGQFFLFLFK